MKVTTLLVFNNIFKTEFEQAYLLAHFSDQEKELSKLFHYYEEES